MISIENIEDTVKTNKVVVLKFFADWCNSCKNYEYYLNDKDEQYKLINIDYDLNCDIIEYYDIAVLPTLIIYIDGQYSEKITGFISKGNFLKKINSYDI